LIRTSSNRLRAPAGISNSLRPSAPAVIFYQAKSADIREIETRQRENLNRFAAFCKWTIRRSGWGACAAPTREALGRPRAQPPHVVSALPVIAASAVASILATIKSRYRAEVAVALQLVADLLDALSAGENNIVAIRGRQ
jgi:hypothetical protein